MYTLGKEGRTECGDEEDIIPTILRGQEVEHCQDRGDEVQTAHHDSWRNVFTKPRTRKQRSGLPTPLHHDFDGDLLLSRGANLMWRSAASLKARGRGRAPDGYLLHLAQMLPDLSLRHSPG